MASTSAWGTRRKAMLLIQMVAVTMLLINLTLKVQGAVETPDHPNVVDAEGHPVLFGEEYYVLPAVTGSGGGLALKLRVNNSCPMYVDQESSEKSRGLPVVFTPFKGRRANFSSVIVEENVALNVKTAAVTTCVQSTEWSEEHDANTTKRFIKASDTSSLFQIAKASDGDGYNVYYCPCICNLVCTQLGIYVDGDKNRWVVIDNSVETLRVQFHKNE